MRHPWELPESFSSEDFFNASDNLITFFWETGITDTARITRALREENPFRVGVLTPDSGGPVNDSITVLHGLFDRLGFEDQRRCRQRLAKVCRALRRAQANCKRSKCAYSVRDLSRLDSKRLEFYIAAIVALDADCMYAGLAVLIKDAEHYLTGLRGGLDATTRCEIAAARECFLPTVKKMDAVLSGSLGPSDYRLVAKDSRLPSGVTAGAARSKADLAPLMADRVRTELTVKVGKEFLFQLADHLNSICNSLHDPDSGLELRRDYPAAELRYVIARDSLRHILSVSPFWYPLAAYLGGIVTRLGLASFTKSSQRGPMRLPYTISRIK